MSTNRSQHWLAVSLVMSVSGAGTSLAGQAAASEVRQLGEARRHTTMFLQFGAWAPPEGDSANIAAHSLGRSAVVWRLTWNAHGAHVNPYQLSIGTVGRRSYPLAGFPAPALQEFARDARLRGRDTSSAREVAAHLVTAMTLTTCGGPVLPTIQPVAGEVVPVAAAWEAARRSGVVDTMWMSHWLGERWSHRDAAGSLFLRFPALRCVVDGLWAVDQWALAFSRDGTLVDWAVRDGGEFVVPP